MNIGTEIDILWTVTTIAIILLYSYIVHLQHRIEALENKIALLESAISC